jgi:hypothetical protein
LITKDLQNQVLLKKDFLQDHQLMINNKRMGAGFLTFDCILTVEANEDDLGATAYRCRRRTAKRKRMVPGKLFLMNLETGVGACQCFNVVEIPKPKFQTPRLNREIPGPVLSPRLEEI